MYSHTQITEIIYLKFDIRVYTNLPPTMRYVGNVACLLLHQVQITEPIYLTFATKTILIPSYSPSSVLIIIIDSTALLFHRLTPMFPKSSSRHPYIESYSFLYFCVQLDFRISTLMQGLPGFLLAHVKPISSDQVFIVFAIWWSLSR